MSSLNQRRPTMEQRQHERFPAHFRSAFSSVNRVEGHGTVIDLSLRGCGIVSPTVMHPGTTLTLRIHVPAPETALTVQQAVVRWCRDGRIGLEFLSLPPEEWARLQRIVKELTRHPYERTHDRQEDSGA